MSFPQSVFMKTCIALLIAVGLSSAASAQNGALTGVVRDSSGAVIPGTTIVVHTAGTAGDRIFESGRDGRFTISPIADGEYTIDAIAPGFAVSNTSVHVPATAPLALVLTPAAVIEAVQVVSASRQQELRESLNTNVNVISRRQIDENGSETVAELLREVPGVMSRRGSEGSGVGGEQVQGIDSRQVLVLLDGQPLVGARGIKSGVINLDRQSSARLEQVEIVKGAASALYGSDALGGVINLITRQATAPFDTTGELSGANRGEFNAVAQAGGRGKRGSGLFSIERHQNDGYDLTPTTFDTTAAPFERVDFMGRARLQVSAPLSLSLLVNGYDNHTGGRANGELGPQENSIDDSTLNVNLQADWLPRAGTTVQARAYTSRYDEDSTAKLAPPASTPLDPGRLDERMTKIDGSFAQVIGSRQQLQGGAEYWKDEYSGLNRVRTDGGESASIATAWLQHKLTIGGRVTTTLGVRSDSHSEFGTAVSPKAAINATVANGLNVRASYGRGFRAPDIGQLYYRFLNPSSIYQVIGNLELRPEYANSMQAGADYFTPGRRARFGVNIFRNNVTDLIESVSLGVPTTPQDLTALLAREGLDASFRPVVGRLLLTYRNISDAVTEGVEVDGDVAITSQLSLSGAYTYLDARDDKTDLRLTGRNEHMGSVRATYRHPIGLVANIRGNFYGNWVAARSATTGDTLAPGYGLWDAYVSQRIVRGINAFVAIDNIADDRDPNLGKLSATGSPLAIYRPDAGRTARFGVRWSWSK